MNQTEKVLTQRHRFPVTSDRSWGKISTLHTAESVLLSVEGLLNAYIVQGRSD